MNNDLLIPMLILVVYYLFSTTNCGQNAKLSHSNRISDKDHTQGEITVEPLITHTPRWTAQGMGYEGSWV